MYPQVLESFFLESRQNNRTTSEYFHPFEIAGRGNPLQLKKKLKNIVMLMKLVGSAGFVPGTPA